MVSRETGHPVTCYLLSNISLGHPVLARCLPTRYVCNFSHFLLHDAVHKRLLRRRAVAGWLAATFEYYAETAKHAAIVAMESIYNKRCVASTIAIGSMATVTSAVIDRPTERP